MIPARPGRARRSKARQGKAMQGSLKPTMKQEETKAGRFQVSVDVQVVRERLRKLNPNEVATYSELSDLIKRDIQHVANSVLQSARHMLLRDGIVFDVIPKEGVKRIVNGEVVDAAKTGLERIHRQAKRSAKIIGCAEYDKLSPEKKVEMNTTASMLGALAQASRPKTFKAVETKVAQNGRLLSIGESLELFR